MSVALIAPGRVMLRGTKKAVLWRPTRTSGGSGGGGSGGSGSFAGPYPSAIAGQTGWWDAGLLTSILDPGGNPVSAWGGTVGSLADKSGAGSPLTVYHNASVGTVAPQATPRLSGLLGGVGLNTVVPPAVPASGYLAPVMDPDSGLSLASMQMGSGSDWTLYLVWSRPNYRQGGSSAPIQLLTLNGTAVLSADSVAGASRRLILFPGGSQTILSSALDRRHSHAIIIRHTHGVGLDVWIDGTQVATAAVNPLASSASGALLFLHSGSGGGGAECWFHESATWGRALSSSDIATLIACQGRWALGARKGVELVVIGQSNAIYGMSDGAWMLLAQGVAWHLGALAYNTIAGAGGSTYTAIGGHGISNEPFSGVTYIGASFLADPGDGSSPAGWALGADGAAVQAYIASKAAADVSDIVALIFPWTETDSLRPYSEKAFYTAAVQRLLSLLRSGLTRTAASLPAIWWNAIPFPYGPNDGGMQMVRESIADIAAISAQHLVIGLPQTSDSNPRGSTWDPSTGIATGGDNDHRDATDNLRFGRLAAPVVARAILAASGGDSLSVIPAGIPVAGGPKITHVYRQSSTVLILTVQHDIGTDLIVPLRAASGAGFAVMDGGSVASPGAIILATACARIDATHLQVTLASAMANASASCQLFYPYGTTHIYRGNAVTDNASTITPPAGWNIGGDLGSAWNLNYPLAATGYGITLSTSP